MTDEQIQQRIQFIADRAFPGLVVRSPVVVADQPSRRVVWIDYLQPPYADACVSWDARTEAPEDVLEERTADALRAFTAGMVGT